MINFIILCDAGSTDAKNVTAAQLAHLPLQIPPINVKVIQRRLRHILTERNRRPRRELEMQTSKNTTLTSLDSRCSQICIAPGKNANIIKRHVTAEREINEVRVFVESFDDGRSCAGKCAVRRDIVGVRGRRDKEGLPVRIRDVEAG